MTKLNPLQVLDRLEMEGFKVVGMTDHIDTRLRWTMYRPHEQAPNQN